MEGDTAKAAPTSKWTHVDGLRIHYRTSTEVIPKERPRIVLVHGLIVSSRYMVPTLKQLSRHYRIYAPDLPGFGKSEKPSHILNVAGLSDALSAWMDAVGDRKSTRLNSSHANISYAVFCLKKKKK